MHKLVFRHQAEQRRFCAEVDGHRLELDYQRRGDQLVFHHTGTAPALQGQGLAGQMVEHALQWAAPLGLQLVPACSYVAAYVQRHPRWQRLLEPSQVQQVLNYWFGSLGGETHGQIRSLWFEKSEATDAEIGNRFGALIEQALAGELSAWQTTPMGSLALIIVLDQFTRNTFRASARAFSGDAQALQSALALLESADCEQIEPVQRWFVLMPLEHAEDPAVQRRSIAEFEALAQADSRLVNALDYARRHQQVIERFGRFPHRNQLLGRASTPQEEAYLAQPGSGF